MHRMWLFLPSQTVTGWKKQKCRPRFTRALGKFVDPIMEFPCTFLRGAVSTWWMRHPMNFLAIGGEKRKSDRADQVAVLIKSPVITIGQSGPLEGDVRWAFPLVPS